MTDLNEYVAEAVEVAYGVDYDTEKATKLIAKLEQYQWQIVDAERLGWLERIEEAAEDMPIDIEDWIGDR